jgi:hypothetical protein
VRRIRERGRRGEREREQKRLLMCIFAGLCRPSP